MLSKSVRLAAGERVRLPSGLSPFVSLLVTVAALSPFCLLVSLFVSLLFGHCVRLVSLLSPSVSGLVSLLVGPCVLPCTVSALSPFCLRQGGCSDQQEGRQEGRQKETEGRQDSSRPASTRFHAVSGRAARSFTSPATGAAFGAAADRWCAASRRRVGRGAAVGHGIRSLFGLVQEHQAASPIKLLLQMIC